MIICPWLTNGEILTSNIAEVRFSLCNTVGPITYVDCYYQGTLELGTQAYPFKMLDDPIRELLNTYADRHINQVINVKGSC